MIYDDISSPGAPKRIVTTIAIDHPASLVFIAHTKTNVPNNDVVASETD
jgi:hypothetical protein